MSGGIMYTRCGANVAEKAREEHWEKEDALQRATALAAAGIRRPDPGFRRSLEPCARNPIPETRNLHPKPETRNKLL